MKANELRIGNFIIYLPEPDLIKMISGIKIERDINNREYERIFFIDENMSDCRGKTPNWIKPISLTKKWLLDFGFEKSKTFQGHNSMKHKAGLHLVKSKNHYELLIKIGSSIILSELRYVHQLQNLYFALTEKELTIKS